MRSKCNCNERKRASLPFQNLNLNIQLSRTAALIDFGVGMFLEISTRKRLCCQECRWIYKIA